MIAQSKELTAMPSASFRKKILTQAIVAGFSLSMAGSAFASNMYLNNNSITIGTSTATVNSSGIISTVVVTRATDSTTLPDITLPLRGLPFSSTYTYRIGLQVSNGSNILEVRLGVALLTTDAVGQLNSQLAMSDSAGDPAYEKTYVYVKLGGNVTITSEFGVPADMITASGNDVTLDISKIIDELTLPGSQADALAAFTAAGNLTYKLAITDQLGGGATTDTLGHLDGAYTASTQAIAWNDATLSSNFAGASVLSGTLVIQNADTGGGTTPDPDPDPDTGDNVVDPNDVEELDNQADDLDNTVNDEINSGTVSEGTVTQTQEATNTAQTQTTTVVEQLNSGTNVSTDNVLSVLSTTTKIVNTSSTIVSSGTTTNTGTLGTQTGQLLNSTTQVLEQLANKTTTGTTTLTTTQQQTVLQSVNTLLQSTSKLSTTSTNLNDSTNTANTVTRILNASANMGLVPDTTQVNNVVTTLQKNAVQQILGSNQQPDDTTVSNLLQDPVQGPKILQATPDTSRLNQPPIQTVEAQVRAGLQVPTGISQEQVDNLVRINSQNSQLTQSIINQSPANDIVSGLSASIPGSGTNNNASVDNVTGNLSINFGGLNFVGQPTKLKIVPDSTPATTLTEPDGSVTVINNGKAVTLTPSAADPVQFRSAVGNLGFPDISQNTKGGIDVNLGGGSKLSGTFAFDPVTTSGSGGGTTTTLTGPTGSPTSPSYTYKVNYPNGTSQNIQPMVSDDNVYTSLDNMGLDINTNRSTGVMNVGGTSVRPDYFVQPLSADDQTFLQANQDSSGVAYRQVDANNDGVTDYEVISAKGKQIVYGVP
jgi:hypothetical protein